MAFSTSALRMNGMVRPIRNNSMMSVLWFPDCSIPKTPKPHKKVIYFYSSFINQSLLSLNLTQVWCNFWTYLFQLLQLILKLCSGISLLVKLVLQHWDVGSTCHFTNHSCCWLDLGNWSQSFIWVDFKLRHLLFVIFHFLRVFYLDLFFFDFFLNLLNRFLFFFDFLKLFFFPFSLWCFWNQWFHYWSVRLFISFVCLWENACFG